MEIFSRDSISNEFDSYVPVAVEIPASELAKIPDGQDLLIRVKKNSTITNEYIPHNEEICSRRASSQIGDEDDYVFRVKKPSICPSIVSTESVVGVGGAHGHHVEGEHATRKTSRQEGLAQLMRTLSGASAFSSGSRPERRISRKEKDEHGHGGERIKKISRVEISGDDIERIKRISREGPADYHIKHVVEHHQHHYPRKPQSSFRTRELSTPAEFEEEENIGTGTTASPTPSGGDGLRSRKTSVFYPHGFSLADGVANETFEVDEKDKDGKRHEQLASPVGGESPCPGSKTGQVVIPFNPDDYDSKQWPQVIAAFAANMGALAFGSVMAWSATGLASLHNKHDGMPDTSKEEDSWIGSLAILGALCACPLAGVGLEKIGRRKVMIYLTLPFVLGWLSIALAQNIWMIYSGRFLTGLCGGAFSMAAPAFTAETADPKIRGGLGSLFDLLLSVGMLYIYVIGAFADWRMQAYACAIIPILFHLLMFFVPESPRFLVEKEKTAKAEKAIYWLKGVKTSPELIEYELSELEKSVGDLRGKKLTVKDTLRKPIIKPTILMVGIMFFTTMSGVDAVVAYTVDIFESAGAEMNSHLSSIIIGIVIVVATIPAAVLVDHAGRRILLLISEVFMSIALIGLGGYFHIKANNLVLFGWIDFHTISWLPLACLIAFIIAYSLGCGPLCMVMTGELLPNYMKGLTSSVVLMSRWGFAFFVTKFFEGIKEDIGDDVTYWGFAAVCSIGALFVYFFIPETMGKSVDEIQIYFVKVSKDKKKVSVVEDFSMHDV